MKRILLIFSLTMSLVACSQNQTWSGAKTFAPSLKFLGVLRNDSNNMVLTINSITGKPEWRDANSFTSSVPTLDQVLNAGPSSPRTIFITDDDVYNTAIYKQGVYTSSNLTNGQSVIYSDSLQTQNASTNTRAVLKSDGTLKLGTIAGGGNTIFKATTGSTNVVLDSPGSSGTIALLSDIPSSETSAWADLTLKNGATAYKARYRTKGDWVEIELVALVINSSFGIEFLTVPSSIKPPAGYEGGGLIFTGYSISTNLPVLFMLSSTYGDFTTITNTTTEALALTIQYKLM